MLEESRPAHLDPANPDRRDATDPIRPPDRPRIGVPGRELLKFVGMIDPEDLAAMAKAIEEDCERIDYDGW